MGKRGHASEGERLVAASSDLDGREGSFLTRQEDDEWRESRDGRQLKVADTRRTPSYVLAAVFSSLRRASGRGTVLVRCASAGSMRTENVESESSLRDGEEHCRCYHCRFFLFFPALSFDRPRATGKCLKLEGGDESLHEVPVQEAGRCGVEPQKEWEKPLSRVSSY